MRAVPPTAVLSASPSSPGRTGGAPLRRRVRPAAVLTTSVALLTGLAVGPAAADARQSVYGDGLAAGWSDWSWGGSLEAASPTGQGGSAALSYRVDTAWGGLYLHTDDAVGTSPDTALELAVRPEDEGAVLGLVLYGDDLRPIGDAQVLAGGAALPAGRWSSLRVPLRELGADGRAVTGLSLQDLSGRTGQRLHVDDVAFSATAGAPAPVAAPPAAPQPAAPQPVAPAPVVPQPVAPQPVDPQPAGAREVRPDNAVPNATRGRPTDPSQFFGHEGFRPYYAKVDGAFTGTTEEILGWAAAKWGFDAMSVPDLARAMAVTETWWRQEHVGANGELGILQVRPGAWPDPDPARWSTAYSADYGMAVVRSHYDGNSWLGEATRGDLRGSVAAWECGCAGNGGGWYASQVFGNLQTRPWLRPGVPPEWF